MLRVPLFFPLYFATFVVLNLLSYPGPEVDRSAISPLGGIADVRLWAVAIRIPYFLTMLWAMWKVAPEPASLPSDSFAGPKTFSDSTASFLAQKIDPFTARRGLTLMAGAGLMNAMIAGFLFCRLPDSYTPTIASLSFRAVIFVALGAVAGIGGTWFSEQPFKPIQISFSGPVSLFSLVCAAGWIWVPAMVILYDQIARATAIVAMIGALLLGIGFRRHFSACSDWSSKVSRVGTVRPFAESLYRPPTEPFGYVIAIGLFAGAYALIEKSIFAATGVLAFISFLFAWNKTHVPCHGIQGEFESRKAAMRLAYAALPAVLITIWAVPSWRLLSQSRCRNSCCAGCWKLRE